LFLYFGKLSNVLFSLGSGSQVRVVNLISGLSFSCRLIGTLLFSDSIAKFIRFPKVP